MEDTPQPQQASAGLTGIGFNRKELRSTIEIDAPPERIWGILTDFPRFPEWSPFIRAASGKVEKGQKLNVTLQPSGGRSLKIKPTVLVAEPNRELRWVGHLGVPGVFDGEHIFELKPLFEGTTRFVQREEFGGIILYFLTGMLKSETARGFLEMNRALKERAEDLSSSF